MPARLPPDRASRNSGSVGRWLVFVVDRHAIAVSGLDAGLDARIGGQALHQPCSQHDNADDHEECRHVLLHAHPVAGIVGMRAGVTGHGACQRWRRLDGPAAPHRSVAAVPGRSCQMAGSRSRSPHDLYQPFTRRLELHRMPALPAACARARCIRISCMAAAGTMMSRFTTRSPGRCGNKSFPRTYARGKNCRRSGSSPNSWQ